MPEPPKVLLFRNLTFHYSCLSPLDNKRSQTRFSGLHQVLDLCLSGPFSPFLPPFTPNTRPPPQGRSLAPSPARAGPRPLRSPPTPLSGAESRSTPRPGRTPEPCPLGEEPGATRPLPASGSGPASPGAVPRVELGARLPPRRLCPVLGSGAAVLGRAEGCGPQPVSSAGRPRRGPRLRGGRSRPGRRRPPAQRCAELLRPECPVFPRPARGRHQLLARRRSDRQF